MSIGTKIFELRTAKNLSQEDLADILNVSRQSVSKWETDTSIPDLDKLIKLCDLFDVTLDELTCREPKEKTHQPSALDTAEKDHQITQQKIIGYILLGVSLLASILVWLFAEGPEDLDLPIPIIATALACSLICLFVKHKAGYWCAWAISAPLVVLSPHFIGFPIFTSEILLSVILSLIMTLIANKLFTHSIVTTSNKKTKYIILGWGSLIIFRIVVYVIVLHTIIASAIAMLPFITLSLIAYVYTSLLLTYTVCYIKSLKRHK